MYIIFHKFTSTFFYFLTFSPNLFSFYTLLSLSVENILSQKNLQISKIRL